MKKEIHPIQDSPPGKTPEERIRHLELHLAMLWDMVWWMNLPQDRRDAYRAEGFTDPIQKFYTEGK